jgi:integrase
VRAIIGAKLLNSKAAQPAPKPFEIYDSRLPGFTLRVQPSGVRSYYARLGRNRRVALGKVGQYKPDEARDRCEKVLGNVAHGRHPLHGLDGADSVTLGKFITDTYAPWAKAHRPRTAQMTLDRVELHFAKWYEQPLTDITLEDLENWRTKRITQGTEPSTVRRDLDTLASVLTRAVKLGHLPENVVRKIERPRIDRAPKVRYLTRDEEVRLREALEARDQEMRDARASANAWRRARKREPLAALPHYGDHLTPAVLLSMNTGMRRGELLSLRWSAVDFKAKQLTIEGSTAKNQQTRHLPLNSEALETLKAWREQAPAGDRVFAIDTGFKSAWGPLLVRAKLTNFRWHDLRHHFASRLVQAGVPLNTVRELLGHGSLAMTLRYAHLAPDQKREAVAKLVQAVQAPENTVPTRRKEG